MDAQQETDVALAASSPLDPRAPATAVRIRQAILESLHNTGGGHYGGCASCIEILLAICASRPLACRNGAGDRLLLSKGHASMALYAVLSLTGPVPLPLDRFGTFGSPLQGHPDRRRLPIVDFSFGSLGQGIGVGCGLALGIRAQGDSVWVVMGDGECQEGMVWESAMLAARYRIANLRVIVDANDEQECGWGHDPGLDQRTMADDLAKWRAFGWRAEEVDGHDLEALSRWVQDQVANSDERPSVLLARTRKSLGTSVNLSRFRRHHTELSADEFSRLAHELREAARRLERLPASSCDARSEQ
jgi:transketolase